MLLEGLDKIKKKLSFFKKEDPVDYSNNNALDLYLIEKCLIRP
jgi:hypothetical protein